MPIDATKIKGNLYQGGEPPMGRALARAGFDVLVLAAEEVQPNGWEIPGVLVLRLPMKDVPELLTPSQWHAVEVVARAVQTLVEHGRKVLVTCKMGWNRSGLIVAETLILNGMSPIRAIQLVRDRRGGLALSNPAFVHALVTRSSSRPRALV